MRFLANVFIDAIDKSYGYKIPEVSVATVYSTDPYAPGNGVGPASVTQKIRKDEMIRRLLASATTLALGVALLGAAPTARPHALWMSWSKIQSYTADIKVHEVKGTDSQDRTYHYSYLKPHFARIDITGGPGKGGGAVWKGGDTVSGHQGGPAQRHPPNQSVHDPGPSICSASRSIKARSRTWRPGSIRAGNHQAEESWNGVVYDLARSVQLPANATKRVIYLSSRRTCPRDASPMPGRDHQR